MIPGSALSPGTFSDTPGRAALVRCRVTSRGLSLRLERGRGVSAGLLHFPAGNAASCRHHAHRLIEAGPRASSAAAAAASGLRVACRRPGPLRARRAPGRRRARPASRAPRTIDLRHEFITAALGAGVPLRDVQEAASHVEEGHGRWSSCSGMQIGMIGPQGSVHHGLAAGRKHIWSRMKLVPPGRSPPLRIG
jgi:hypothetical protein